MRKALPTLLLVSLVACSSNASSPALQQAAVQSVPSASKKVAQSTSVSNGVSLTLYGPAAAFRQTEGADGIAYDGQGGLWISSPTAFEHQSGSSTYVIDNGLGASSASDYWHSIFDLVALNGYVYGIGFDGTEIPAMVRISSNGTRSILPISGLGSTASRFADVAAGANAVYGIWPLFCAQTSCYLLRISAYGELLDKTALAPISGTSSTSYPDLAVSPATGEAYVVEQGSFAQPVLQVARFSASGSLERTYTISNNYVANTQFLNSATTATIGPDGKLYFPASKYNIVNTDCIFVLDPTSGSQSCFQTPTQPAAPASPVVGSDGNIWFVEQTGQKLARMTLSGTITEFPEPLQNPAQLAAAPQGAIENPSTVWFIGQQLTGFSYPFDSVRATF